MTTEIRGLPAGGVPVPSGGIYGAMKFSKEEIEAALGRSLSRFPQSQLCNIVYSFQIN